MGGTEFKWRFKIEFSLLKIYLLSFFVYFCWLLRLPTDTKLSHSCSQCPSISFVIREERKKEERREMWPFSRRGASGFSWYSTAEEVTEGLDGSGLTAIVTGLPLSISIRFFVLSVKDCSLVLIEWSCRSVKWDWIRNGACSGTARCSCGHGC